ncbi:MAG: hypothetical protein DCF31_10950 [Alphaproteobacteria bacterium]|nr:MAG: hypothetical protein DCF31_10950 [Alphaproteobacteria bacterium]
MAWTAVAHLQASPLAMPDDPAVIGVDRALAAALVCLAAVPGLLWARTRQAVAVAIMMGIVYAVSARRLAGTLDADAWALVPMFAAALYLWWPRLVEVKRDG